MVVADLQSAREIGDQIVSTDLYATPGAYDRLFDAIRRESPVVWADPEGYSPFWVISRHADIKEVERQPAKFINAPRILLRSDALNAQIRKITGDRPFLLRNLTNMDGKDHIAHRMVTQEWFHPGRVRALEGEIRALARQHIEKMVSLGAECDFARDVAVWYPLRVIMSILGVPPEDEPKMLQLTLQIFGPDDPEIKQQFKGDVVEAVSDFFDYFRAIAEHRRANPGDDLGTVIARAEIDGKPMGDLETLSYFILAATAGHDTTSSTTSGGLLALLQNPDQMVLLRAQPDLLPGAIEEMIRHVTPVTHFFRTATVDYELNGQEIKAGDSLMLCYRSANRDEAVFADPYRFDIARQPNNQLAFGYGPHVCLGQHLARLEVRVFFEEFLRRVESVELAGTPRWLATNFVGGLKSLPIRSEWKF